MRLDPAIRFWFGVYSSHRSLWRSYPEEKKHLLIHEHAAFVFEDWCRSRHPGAQRYWEKSLEIDLVCPDPEDPARLLVGEAKWKRLTTSEHASVLRELKGKWERCALGSRHPDARFQVFDASSIEGKP
jgi:AAA+ ATPase superfamily predicted ATPase